MDEQPEPTITRLVHLDADPDAMLMWRNGVLYLAIDMTIGCDCYPHETQFVTRVHCMS